MFKRVLYDDWQQFIPIAAFLITFAAFVIFVVRALRMHREDAGRMASLPLENESKNNHE